MKNSKHLKNTSFAVVTTILFLANISCMSTRQRTGTTMYYQGPIVHNTPPYTLKEVPFPEAPSEDNEVTTHATTSFWD